MPFAIVDVAFPTAKPPVAEKVPMTVEEAWETNALAKVPRPVRLSVPLKMLAPVVVKLPATVDEACERKPLVSVSVEEKVLTPAKVLLSVRSVEEAAV